MWFLEHTTTNHQKYIDSLSCSIKVTSKQVAEKSMLDAVTILSGTEPAARFLVNTFGSDSYFYWQLEGFRCRYSFQIIQRLHKYEKNSIFQSCLFFRLFFWEWEDLARGSRFFKKGIYFRELWLLELIG